MWSTPVPERSTGTAFRKPVLIVHRSLCSEADELYKPVADFLSRHRHEVVSGPTRISGEGDIAMFGPSEFTMYRLLDYPEVS